MARRPHMRSLAAACIAATAATLVACDDTSGDLQQYLVSDVPGYTLSAGDSGPLDGAAAAASLPTDSSATIALLQADRFRSGYSRVFLRGGAAGGDYAIVAVYTFQDAPGAAGFVAAEHSALAATGTVTLFAVDGVAGSAGFVLTGSTKRGNRSVFCDGAIFPRQARAYAVTTCSAAPLDASLAIALAQRQSRHQP